ncbi:MAG TPA: Nif11-like leader peptide family RiPP precursor [Coleofasciculaceae cyanobacterium]|jgi:predicted ribosomally synthesized peptide with nif11-like leader
MFNITFDYKKSKCEKSGNLIQFILAKGGTIMAKENATRIYKKVEQAHAQQERQKALGNPKAFIELAKARGYDFKVEDLEAQLSQLSDEDVAGIFNPGIGLRRHIFPK